MNRQCRKHRSMDKEELLNELYNCDEFFKYLHMLRELYKFVGHDVVVKNGIVRRLFHDDEFDDMVFEFETGNMEYVSDVNLMNVVCFMESFKNEYPNEYEAFMKTYVGLKKEDILTFFKEDADLLTKVLMIPGN